MNGVFALEKLNFGELSNIIVYATPCRSASVVVPHLHKQLVKNKKGIMEGIQ